MANNPCQAFWGAPGCSPRRRHKAQRGSSHPNGRPLRPRLSTVATGKQDRIAAAFNIAKNWSVMDESKET